MTDKPLECPFCRKRFAELNDCWQHAKAKHKGEKITDLRPARDDEPSMGSLVAEANWNDDPDLDWVREMFSFEEISGAGRVI